MSFNVTPDVASFSREDTARLVRAARLKKQLTQKELAKMAGISVRSLQRIENGEVLARAYTWRQLGNHIDLKTVVPPVQSNPEVTKSNPPRKWILSIGSLVALVLAFSAFVIQSPTFPENLFETLNMLLAGCIMYAGILYRIWK